MDSNNGKMDLCSICCVSYNHASYIEHGIKSLWEQDYKNIEIIALDDGSNDSSSAILEALKLESPVPMKVIINDHNTGNVGANFNKVMKEASGKFIMFMSLDDMLFKDAISSKIFIMIDNKNISFITNSVTSEIDNNNLIVCNVTSELDKISTPTWDDLLHLEYWHSHSFFIQGTLFRKDVVDAVNGFDEDMTGDDIVLRTKISNYSKAHGFVFVVHHSPSCYYRQHSTNIHKNRYRQVKIISEYLERYHSTKPMPKHFKKYFISSIKKIEWTDISDYFTMNSITRKFIYNPEAWIAIVKKVVRSLLFLPVKHVK